MTWRTVHKHIVSDAFRSKKSLSALLVPEQKASQKWGISSRHSIAFGDYKRNTYANTSATYSIYKKVPYACNVAHITTENTLYITWKS